MMEFTSFNIFVRQVVNGTMALAALLLLLIFARYVWRNKGSLRQNDTVQAAVAIMILMSGHFMRASSSWIEFMLLDAGMDTTVWLKWTWVSFMLAFVGIVVGKVLMLKTFAPRHWLRGLVFIGIPACAIIPLLIAISLH